MTTVGVVIGALFALGIGLIVYANFEFYSILTAVNQTLPSDRQISVLGVNTKYHGVLKMHAQVFPSSAKRRKLQLLWRAGVACTVFAFIIDALAFGRW